MASGPLLPSPILDSAGNAVMRPPEFTWHTEIRRLAKRYANFHPGYRASAVQGDKETAEVDRKDFAEALAGKWIAPPDATLAIQQHARGREFLNSPLAEDAALPEEFDSEFRDYHLGAVAFRQGDVQAAKLQFENLLKRPARQRHFRTVWAHYMLARCDEAENVSGHGKALRAALGAGFVDSLDCNSAMLRLEATQDEGLRWELAMQVMSDSSDAGFFRSASSLYLKKSMDELKALASHATLRAVTSCSIMCAATSYNRGIDSNAREACRRWNEAIKLAGVTQVEDADRLAWIAYMTGDFSLTESWLKRCAKPTDLSLWLQAKLDLRAGKLTAALDKMKEAAARQPKEVMTQAVLDCDVLTVPIADAAQGDLAMMQMAAGKFADAVRTFLAGNHWQDAAWVAERLMTVDELKTLVDRDCPWDAGQEALSASVEVGYGDEGLRPMFYRSNYFLNEKQVAAVPVYNKYRLRWLLARRLMREGRRAESLSYFPLVVQTMAKEYHLHLSQAQQKKRAREDRAQDWWKAAWLARSQGMELMGTEMEPDFAVWNGSYPGEGISPSRKSGNLRMVEWVADAETGGGKEIVRNEPLELPRSKLEKIRLYTLPQPLPLRYHYRYTAADYAWQAASLMPDQTEELADVLNSAGRWIARSVEGHDKGYRFYRALEVRCGKTELGKKVLASRWFTGDFGPLIAPLVR